MLKKTFFRLMIVILISSSGLQLQSQDASKSVTSKNKQTSVPLKNFKHADIGNPSIAGNVKISDNGLDISAAGADIWGTKDEFHYAYIEKTGDFDILTRVEGMTARDLYTKAGIMAREDLSASCRHIYFQIFSDNNPRNKNNGGYEFQYRQIKGGEMKAIYPKSASGTPEFPVSFPNTWIRLQRSKNNFTGYYSTDGINWKIYTTYSLELPEKIYLGMAVTSHNVNFAVLAKYRNITELKH
jgi:hypothetical protein